MRKRSTVFHLFIVSLVPILFLGASTTVVFAQKSSDKDLLPIYKKPYRQQAAFISLDGKHVFSLDTAMQLVVKGDGLPIHAFRSGIVLVSKGEKDQKKYYALNNKGEIIHEFINLVPQEIKGDFIYVWNPVLRKYGLLDLDFKVVAPFKYSLIEEFSEGLAAVEIDRKMGFINKNGEEIIPVQFSVGKENGFGKAIYYAKFKNGLTRFVEGGKIGFINKQGEKVIPAQFDIASDFSDGIARVGFYNEAGREEGGYIDTLANWIIPPAEGQYGNYENQMLIKKDMETGLYGFIDLKARWVIKPQYSEVTSFSNGFAVVQDEGADTKKIIDTKGNVVFEGNFVFANFSHPKVVFIGKSSNFAAYYTTSNNYAYYTPSFDLIFEPDCSSKVVNTFLMLKSCDPSRIEELDLSDDGNLNFSYEDLLPHLRGVNPRKLTLNLKNNLKQFPKEILEMSNLEELDLYGNAISSIPDGISRLRKLRILNLEQNQLKHLPETIFELPNLEEINIASNQFEMREVAELKKRLPKTKVIIRSIFY